MVNFDETNIDFGCEVTKTVSCKGVKTVSSACAANSGQLTANVRSCSNGWTCISSPYVISKVKQGGHLEKKELKQLDGYIKGILYTVQRKCMDG